jgi:hypothetical protein
MSQDEVIVLRAAYELGKGEPRLIEYKSLAAQTNFGEAVVRGIAGRLQAERLCLATFGGLQLTATGLKAAVQP